MTSKKRHAFPGHLGNDLSRRVLRFVRRKKKQFLSPDVVSPEVRDFVSLRVKDRVWRMEGRKEGTENRGGGGGGGEGGRQERY